MLGRQLFKPSHLMMKTPNPTPPPCPEGDDPASCPCGWAYYQLVGGVPNLVDHTCVDCCQPPEDGIVLQEVEKRGIKADCFFYLCCVPRPCPTPTPTPTPCPEGDDPASCPCGWAYYQLIGGVPNLVDHTCVDCCQPPEDGIVLQEVKKRGIKDDCFFYLCCVPRPCPTPTPHPTPDPTPEPTPVPDPTPDPTPERTSLSRKTS